MTAYREPPFPLDDDQRAAAGSDARVTLVTGSAGTGKTHVVVARVAHLIRQGCDPKTIACLTTRGGVDLLTRRLAEHPLVAGHIGELFIGDPASLANYFLRAERAWGPGRTSSYSVWTPSRCIDETAARWRESGRPRVRRREFRQVLEWYWYHRAFGRQERIPAYPEQKWYDIMTLYREVKEAQDALDYSDVLYLGADLLDILGNRELREANHPRTAHCARHLVVDQGEEVTIEESDFLRKLARQCRSLLAAWDPNQALREDQGTNLARELQPEFPDMRQVLLTVAHATGEDVAETLGLITSGSEDLWDMDQMGASEDVFPPQVVQVRGSLTDMHLQCIEDVRRLVSREEPVAPDDIALLFGRGRPAGTLRTQLAYYDIPCRLLAGPEVSRPGDGRAVAALLAALLNSKDLFALRVAAAPGYPNKDRLAGRALARRLAGAIAEAGPAGWKALRALRDGLPEEDPDLAVVTGLVSALERLEAAVAAPGATLVGVVETAAAVVEEAKGPHQRGRPDQDRDLLRLRRLAERAPQERWETVREQVQELVDRWVMGEAGPPEGEGGVAIGPISAAKGQRWPVVFVLDVQEEKMPGKDAARARDRLAREATRFYLAASRANGGLVFCMPEPGDSPESRITRFLAPLVEDGAIDVYLLPEEDDTEETEEAGEGKETEAPGEGEEADGEGTAETRP